MVEAARVYFTSKKTYNNKWIPGSMYKKSALYAPGNAGKSDIVVSDGFLDRLSGRFDHGLYNLSSGEILLKLPTCVRRSVSACCIGSLVS